MSLESDIADLMRQSGRSRAESNLAAARIAITGRQERDAIRSNLFTNLAQIAANVPTQIIAAKQAATEADLMRTRQQVQQTELQMRQQDAQRLAQGRQVLAEAIKQHTTRTPEGLPKPDYQAIATSVTEAGFPDVASSWLRMTSENADAVTKLTAGTVAQQRKTLEEIGNVAASANTREDFLAGVGLLASHGIVDEQTAHRIAASIDSEQWQQIRDQYRQFSPKYQESRKPQKLSAGEKIVIPGEDGSVVAENPKAPSTLAELAADAANPTSPTARQSAAAVTTLQAPTVAAQKQKAEHDAASLRIAALNAEANMIRARRGPTAGARGNRGVTSGDANRIAEMTTGIKELEGVDATKTGARSWLESFIPNVVTSVTGWGAGTKERQAVINKVKQIIGKSLEGGVLRKEDEEKYKLILPTIDDAPEVAASKLKGLKDTIERKRGDLLSALEDAGYDTTRFGMRVQTPATDKKNPFR